MWSFRANLIPCKTLINVIISNVSLSGNYTNIVGSSRIFYFMILKSFYVKIHPPNVPKTKEMMWLPPVYLWIKCNIDGIAHGSQGPTSCGGIFRDYQANFLGCFASNIGISYALNTETMGVILAIELTHEKSWTHLWLEYDSRLVDFPLTQLEIIP